MLCYLNLIMLPTFGLILMLNVGKHTTSNGCLISFHSVEIQSLELSSCFRGVGVMHASLAGMNDNPVFKAGS